MTKETDIVEHGTLLKSQFSDLNGDKSKPAQTRVAITDIVLKIESLYDRIDQEITARSVNDNMVNDAKIEAWSEEIEYLCRKIEIAPIRNSLDLRAKISLHLSLISKSFLDMRSIEMHSQKIMDVLDEYDVISEETELRLVQ